jgi:hypothetical protein
MLSCEFLTLLAFRYIAHGTENDNAFFGFDGTEGDIGRKLAAV